ncbi:MAG: hypothetical protein RIC57_05785 [Balneola sp.]|jgi:hypothetical protein|tara:strand:- start:129959 stop:130618 length:660 start_codon:yes stop_codon:yes gene_type:complete
MKKIILLLFVFVASTTFLAAQSFKPIGGEWGAEVNFTPFSSSPVNIEYIRLRKFINDNTAFRLGLFLGGEIRNPDNDPANDEKTTNQTLEINLLPGFEQHIAGTDRLSPYLGAELDLAFKFSKTNIEDDGRKESIEGAWTQLGSERGFFRIGVKALSGFDFYFSKSIYLGTEFGFGIEYIQQTDIEYKIGDLVINETPGGSFVQVGPTINGSIRLGYNF